LSPDGKVLASGGVDRTLRTWDAATGKELTRRPHAGPIICVAFSPDGGTLAAGCSDTTISLWEAAPAPSDVVLAHGGEIRGLAFSPDGRSLVSTGHDPARYWDVATGHSLAAPDMGWADALTAKGIAPDARTL